VPTDNTNDKTEYVGPALINNAAVFGGLSLPISGQRSLRCKQHKTQENMHERTSNFVCPTFSPSILCSLNAKVLLVTEEKKKTHANTKQ
jgi:hypothetical protein